MTPISSAPTLATARRASHETIQCRPSLRSDEATHATSARRGYAFGFLASLIREGFLTTEAFGLRQCLHYWHARPKAAGPFTAHLGRSGRDCERPLWVPRRVGRPR